MAMEPQTGYIKAWVGGINYKYFQYDHVRSNRQVGSTFKPFVYATAIDQKGISPCYSVYDVPQTIQPGEGLFRLSKSWTPKNAGSYTGRGRGRDMTVTVTSESGALRLKRNPADSGQVLQYRGDDTFAAGGALVIFDRKDGKPVRLRLDAGYGHNLLNRQ